MRLDNNELDRCLGDASKSVSRIFKFMLSWDWDETPIVMALRLILIGVVKVQLRLISSLMCSRVE